MSKDIKTRNEEYDQLYEIIASLSVAQFNYPQGQEHYQAVIHEVFENMKVRIFDANLH